MRNNVLIQRNQKLVNGQWGYVYDPHKMRLLGGYSVDGVTFTHTFTVYGLKEDEALFACALCGLMYGKTRKVVTTYHELVGDNDSQWRLFRYDVELHNK